MKSKNFQPIKIERDFPDNSLNLRCKCGHKSQNIIQFPALCSSYHLKSVTRTSFFIHYLESQHLLTLYLQNVWLASSGLASTVASGILNSVDFWSLTLIQIFSTLLYISTYWIELNLVFTFHRCLGTKYFQLEFCSGW